MDLTAYAFSGIVSGLFSRHGRLQFLIYYLLCGEVSALEQALQMVAVYYGVVHDWDEKISADSEMTIAQSVVEEAKKSVLQLNLVEAVAEEYGVTLTEEDEADLDARLQATIQNYFGSEAGEEELNAALERQHISREVFDRQNRVNYLSQNIFNELYGEDGEKVPEEDALNYLQENGYLCAACILLKTVDFNTFEKLDDAAIEQKKQQAEELAAELRAIEDPDERAARFAECKEQYCEDEDGKQYFPEGYVFRNGSDAMPEEFAEAVLALQDYEVSEAVSTVYGYYVIMRLPLNADMTMKYYDYNTPLNARGVLAYERFSALMEERLEASAFESAEGFEIDLTQFLRDAE